MTMVRSSQPTGAGPPQQRASRWLAVALSRCLECAGCALTMPLLLPRSRGDGLAEKSRLARVLLANDGKRDVHDPSHLGAARTIPSNRKMFQKPAGQCRTGARFGGIFIFP
jgi:hypothetical protein